MSDLEALYIFLNKPVSSEMVNYLVSTTTSIIQVHDPVDTTTVPALNTFIDRLIHHSHVQTTTLMTTLIYLNRLKNVIPSNSIGMYTTHHRIFLGSLLLAAKFTNDSSPMNKHWTTYTDGLLTLREVNALEIEMIQYIGWEHLNFSNEDLIFSLYYFIEPIKRKLRLKSEEKINSNYTYFKQQQQQSIPPSSTTSSLPSLVSSSSISTASSYDSIPRKDSIQSLASTSSEDSPLIQHKEKIQEEDSPIINSSTKMFSSTTGLRPLKLRPKSLLNYSQSQTNLHSQINNKLPLNIPTTNIPNNLNTSLKHSNRSLSLVQEKENSIQLI